MNNEIYSAKIYVWKTNGGAKPTVLYSGYQLVKQFAPSLKWVNNDACTAARLRAKDLMRNLGGDSASYDVPDHPNQNLRTGFIYKSH